MTGYQHLLTILDYGLNLPLPNIECMIAMDDPVAIFEQHITGEITCAERGFLQSIAKNNPTGFQKLSQKLQQLRLQLGADHIHWVLQGLSEQINLTDHCSDVIRAFFQNTNIQEMLPKILQDEHLWEVHQIQAIIQVMDTLNIFTEDEPESHFMRLMILILLSWHLSEDDERTSMKAAKWIRMILGISGKSSMARIIHWMAFQIHLCTQIIPGEIRNMDCLELFILFQTLSPANTKSNNHQLMTDFRAISLILVICINSPYAFYDVTARHSDEPKYSIIPRSVNGQSGCLQRFIHDSDLFKTYYPCRGSQNRVAHSQPFLWALITHLRRVLPLSVRLNLNVLLDITQYDDLLFGNAQLWVYCVTVIHTIMDGLLHTIHQCMQKEKTQNAGRIRAAALKLMELRGPARSAFTQLHGTFQPLVNTDVLHIDVMNMHALLRFYTQIPLLQRLNFMQEIIELSCTHQARQQTHHASMFKQPAVPVFQKLEATPSSSQYTVFKQVRNKPKQSPLLFSINETKIHTPHLSNHQEFPPLKNL